MRETITVLVNKNRLLKLINENKKLKNEPIQKWWRECKALKDHEFFPHLMVLLYVESMDAEDAELKIYSKNLKLLAKELEKLKEILWK